VTTVLLAGATGLVGGECLTRLLADERVGDVHALVRRPLGRTDPRLREQTVDFARLDAAPVVAATAAICALGTTIKTAGSEPAFRAVDHDAVLAFAGWARRGGADTFALVSSVGADPNARNFYLRVKGEVERAVRAIGFRRLVLVRPSLLLGSRGEPRPGEAFARALAPALNPLMIGPLRRYRAIPADVVAAALVTAALSAPDGVEVWEHDAIVAAAPPQLHRPIGN
jgi:uncharacterized protein YbjT (DUF2867 family)